MAHHVTLHTCQRRRAAGLSVASFFATLMLLAAAPSAYAQSNPSGAQADACAGNDSGITLSPGFCASVFADNLGHVRHMVFGPNGVLYVNTWSGRYYRNDKPPAGGFLVALKDTKGDGPRRRRRALRRRRAARLGRRHRHRYLRRRPLRRTE